MPSELNSKSVKETSTLRMNQALTNEFDLTREVSVQLDRLKNSINRIDRIDEDKKEASNCVKETPFDELSLSEKIHRVLDLNNSLFRQLCYLNEKLEERV